MDESAAILNPNENALYCPERGEKRDKVTKAVAKKARGSLERMFAV